MKHSSVYTPGTIVADRYTIISQLGEGAMGAVFLAQDMELQRQVAIKVLLPSDEDDPIFSKRFDVECSLLAKICPHPNIVILHDRHVDNDRQILVMEYVRGENLSEIMARTFHSGEATPYQRGPVGKDTLLLTPRVAILIALQCLKALDHAHGQGILHRDIKPSNIMVSADPRGGITAKLMDFGIAKFFSTNIIGSSRTRLTSTRGMGPGTPAYMAPEQIEPERFGKIGPSTDLYAFSVMFFEMLTGQLPFTGAFTEVMHSHTNVRPPSPRQINPNIQPALAAVVLRGLQKSPGNRYGRAAEMLEELERAVGITSSDVSGAATQRPLEYQTLRPTRQLPKISFRAVLLLILAGVLGISLWQGWMTGWFGAEEALPEQTGGLTRVQARNVLETLRNVSDTPLVRQYAQTEWETAQQIYYSAEVAADSDEAISLYTEAGRLFIMAPGLAISRDRAARGEDPELASPPKDEHEREPGASEARAMSPLNKRSEEHDRVFALGNGVLLEMAKIRSGSFLMGTPERGRRTPSGGIVSDESPARTVLLTQDFWIGKYEITQEQWQQVMGNTPSRFQSDGHRPVEQVSWYDTQEFVRQLTLLISEGVFRLPTEAEWEYACRAGTRTAYFFGNDVNLLTEYSWCAYNSDGGTNPVGRKKPNAWGLHDMQGNVSEWVYDLYSPTYYGDGEKTNPFGPTVGVARVVRGGTWSNHAQHHRSAARSHSLPYERLDTVGFRVVWQAE